MTTAALPMPRAVSLWRKIPVWRLVFYAIMSAALYAAYLRLFHGLGSATNLSNDFPWGIWIGFDVLCGVGLAAGGFTLVAIVHIFHIERYKPVLRPAILTAFLGYGLVVVALMLDLGRPDRIWHPLVMWNPHSVMFEGAWCVMLYTTVLALEFAPVVLERDRMGARNVRRRVDIRRTGAATFARRPTGPHRPHRGRGRDVCCAGRRRTRCARLRFVAGAVGRPRRRLFTDLDACRPRAAAIVPR